jgi:hypothetical protein
MIIFAPTNNEEPLHLTSPRRWGRIKERGDFLE